MVLIGCELVHDCRQLGHERGACQDPLDPGAPGCVRQVCSGMGHERDDRQLGLRRSDCIHRAADRKVGNVQIDDCQIKTIGFGDLVKFLWVVNDSNIDARLAGSLVDFRAKNEIGDECEATWNDKSSFVKRGFAGLCSRVGVANDNPFGILPGSSPRMVKTWNHSKLGARVSRRKVCVAIAGGTGTRQTAELNFSM